MRSENQRSGIGRVLLFTLHISLTFEKSNHESVLIYLKIKNNAKEYPGNLKSFLMVVYIFYCCSSTLVSVSSPSTSLPTPPIPTSHLQSSPHCLCPWVLYKCSLMILPSFSPIIPLASPLWPLSVCSLFPCLWYFACLFVLLIRFQLKVISYGIYPSLPRLFHFA